MDKIKIQFNFIKKKKFNLMNVQQVLDSMAKGYWLQEDEYTVERFSACATLYARDKISLFHEFSPIYVSSKSPIPHRDLCDLIKCGGGHVVHSSLKSSLIIGKLKPNANSVPCISGTWVLDCIERRLMLPLTNHVLS